MNTVFNVCTSQIRPECERSLFSSIDEKVMADDEFTCDLFRFLQLLCEGHNNGSYDVIERVLSEL